MATISSLRTTPIILPPSQELHVLESGVVVITGATDAVAGFGSNRMLIEGDIQAFDSDGIDSIGGSHNVTVSSTGSVSGRTYAISLRGGGSSLGNNGDITGATIAIVLDGNNNFAINNGRITGRTYGLVFDTLGATGNVVVNNGRIEGEAAMIDPGNGLVITNTGTVRGASYGYVCIGGDSTIANSGTVHAGIFAGVVGSAGVQTVTNSGLISSSSGVALDLGGGNDVYNGQAGTVIGEILGGTGDDTLTGGSGDETIRGGADQDVLTGGGGADRLYGEDGNDRFVGDAGADIFTGGAGTDVADYRKSAAAVNVNLTAGTGSGGDAHGDLYGSIEDVLGSTFDDTLRGDNAANVLVGYDGNDFLYGESGNDRLIGGLGADVFTGGTGVDTADYRNATAGVTLNLATGGSGGEASGDLFGSIEIVQGSAFADDIRGDNGANTLFGNDGTDMLNGDSNDDVLVGGAGADVLSGGSGIDTADFSASSTAVTVNLATGTGSGGDAQGDLYGSIENLIGSAFGDVLTGDSTANRFFGGAGADIHTGGGGTDTIDYSASAAAVSVNLAAGSGSFGDAQGDIYGSIENVIGTVFNDTITGDNAANFIDAGRGNDTINGASGSDTFFFANTSISGLAADYSGFDTVNAFDRVAGAGGDQIQLQNTAFGVWTAAEGGGNTVFSFTDQAFGVIATVTVTGVTGMVQGDDWIIV